jgi:hypothetical protein
MKLQYNASARTFDVLVGKLKLSYPNITEALRMITLKAN